MFVLEGGELMLNEVAPRPHNSGHYTIEACYVSQFEQHLRAVLGRGRARWAGQCGRCHRQRFAARSCKTALRS